MMQKQITVYKLEQPYTFHVMEICSIAEISDIEKVKAMFSRANMIVDAQFYYTNPLLYIFLDDGIEKDFAQLYENYYLIPPRFYDSIEINDDYFAVNQTFISKIGSLTQFSEESATVKPPRKELQALEDQGDSIHDSYFDLYQSHGLYMIGIRKPKQGKEAA